MKILFVMKIPTYVPNVGTLSQTIPWEKEKTKKNEKGKYEKKTKGKGKKNEKKNENKLSGVIDLISALRLTKYVKINFDK